MGWLRERLLERIGIEKLVNKIGRISAQEFIVIKARGKLDGMLY